MKNDLKIQTTKSSKKILIQFMSVMMIMSLAMANSPIISSKQSSSVTQNSKQQKEDSEPTAKSPANTFMQSIDNGKTWQDLSGNLPDNIEIMNMLATNDEVFLGTQNGALYHSKNPKSGLWQREDIGIVLLNFPPEAITGIYEGHTNLFVTLSNGGLLKKAKNMTKWQNMSKIQGNVETHSITESDKGELFASNMNGIFRSKNSGKSWEHVFTNNWVSSLSCINGVVIASGAHGLLRSDDGGNTWNCVFGDEGGVYKIGEVDGQFTAFRVAGQWLNNCDENPVKTFISRDKGLTWHRIDVIFSSDYGIYSLKKADKSLFCSNKAGISKSDDGGGSWKLLKSAVGDFRNNRIELAVSGRTIYAISIFDGC